MKVTEHKKVTESVIKKVITAEVQGKLPRKTTDKSINEIIRIVEQTCINKSRARQTTL